MNMQYTLNEIEIMLEETREYIDEYSKSIDELDKIINDLSQSWISKETKTYESFYSQYKENSSKLLSMQQMMKRFYEKLENQKVNLLETSKEIKNSFE